MITISNILLEYNFSILFKDLFLIILTLIMLVASYLYLFKYSDFCVIENVCKSCHYIFHLQRK